MIHVDEANRSFNHGTAPLSAFHVFHESLAGFKSKKHIKRTNMVEVDGQGKFQASSRFWTSILSRYGFGDTVYSYFSHEEVFERIVKVRGDDVLRFTTEHDPESVKAPSMLAVVGAKAKIPEIPDLLKLFGEYKGMGLAYAAGTFTSRFNPFSGERTVSVGGDDFQERFAMEVPVDGWGKVKTYLEMLRQVCSNGAIAMAPAFRSTVKTGDDMLYSLDRVLCSYDNGEGFIKLRERFGAAQKSWASVYECNGLLKLAARWPVGQMRMGKINEAMGDICRIYGLSSINVMENKQQRQVPARCRVYDLINIASELATHYATNEEARAYQAYIGTLLTENFDLEGTADMMPDFTDFLLDDKKAD